MQKQLYITYLSDTSKSIFPLLKMEINEITFQEKKLLNIISFFYNKRKYMPLLKPTLFRLSYEICGGKYFYNIKNIAAAFEALNISTYQANSAFDNKMGILKKEAKDDQFIASMLSREIATKLIMKSVDTLPSSTINKIINCISISNLNIYKAQHYDLNLLSDVNYKKYAASENKFNEDYHNRCFLGSGIFSGQTALAGAIAANANQEQEKALQLFGEIYGTALHKINDLADFYPGEERSDKLYQDNYCDIKNMRLTFPVYKLRTYYMEKYNELRALIEDNCNVDIINSVNKILADTSLIDDVQKNAREAYNDAKQALSCFEMSHSKQMILTLLSILDSNKFYYRAKNGK